MKKPAAILLLTVITLNSAGFYAWYLSEIVRIKSAMRQRLRQLPDEKLHVLTMPYSVYEEAKVDDHEIRYQGGMFDIARIERSGNNVRVFCLYDAEESELAEMLSTIFTKPIDQKNVPGTIVQYLTLEFIRPDNGFEQRAGFQTIDHAGIYRSDYLGFRQPPAFPPPKAA